MPGASSAAGLSANTPHGAGSQSDGRALVDRCLEYVEENAEQVVKTAGFLELSKKAVVHLVCSDQV